MDNKEAIIQETIKLIEEKGERLDEITVREICKRASVGLGLVNYHFGNKEKLIEQCMSTPPAWCADLPVACESGMADNYGDT